jgi:hypothetical protein
MSFITLLQQGDVRALSYNNYLNEISGSHSSEYEDGCLLGCCIMLSGKIADVSEVLAEQAPLKHQYLLPLNNPEDSHLQQ